MITLKQLMEAIERREEELRKQKETKKRQGKKAAVKMVKSSIFLIERTKQNPVFIAKRIAYFMDIASGFITAMNENGNPAEDKEYFIGYQEETYMWILEACKVDAIANDLFKSLSRREKREFKRIVPHGYDLRNASDKKSVLTDYLGKFITGDIYLSNGRTREGYYSADYQEKRIRESDYIDYFISADSGIFDGFQMVEVFHRIYKKENAIAVTYSDDSAIAYFGGKKYHLETYPLKDQRKKRRLERVFLSRGRIFTGSKRDALVAFFAPMLTF